MIKKCEKADKKSSILYHKDFRSFIMSLTLLDLYEVKKIGDKYTTIKTGEKAKVNTDQVAMVKDLNLDLISGDKAVSKAYLSNGSTIIIEQNKIS
jgi:hypothetical protein